MVNFSLASSIIILMFTSESCYNYNLFIFINAYVFSYEKNAISIRLGRTSERHEVIRNRPQWSPLCIEEPFTHLNTAHSIYDERVFETIKVKFHEAHAILEKTFDLNKLLNVHPSHV